MARFTAFLVLATSLVGMVSAAPVSLRRHAVSRRAFVPLTDYAAFQISSGTGGNALAEANAIFVDPFAGVDLTTVSEETVDQIQAMRDLAEAAEVDQFNQAIEAATGAEADALKVGKTKNKVLKLVASVTKLNVEIAKLAAEGKSTAERESKKAEQQKKVDTNVTADVANAGKASQAVTESAAAAPAPVAAAPVADAEEEVAADEDVEVVADDEEEVAAPIAAAPVVAAPATGAAAGSFQASTDYSSFQISSGTGGNALAEANAIFVDPFNGVDLTTVSEETVDQIQAMRDLAEAAEVDQFNQAIEAATGAEADALKVGKTKNKVLKLVASVTKLNVEIAKLAAAGKSTTEREAKKAEQQKKVDTNVAADKANAGKASQAV